MVELVRSKLARDHNKLVLVGSTLARAHSKLLDRNSTHSVYSAILECLGLPKLD